MVRAVGERETFRANVPRWYRGEAHLAFTMLSSLGMTAALLAQLRGVRAAELWAVPAFFVFCCFAEYLEHRYLLHRNSRASAFAFRIHTLEHHRFFTYGDFAPESRRDWAFVLFPPRLVLAYLVVVAGGFTLLGRLITANVGWLVGATAAGFFFLYEVVHFASHYGAAGWLGEHHRVHHRVERMTGYNFNVVFPLFDWIFGTRARS
jgi:sterol desaturase/sphingolipid hydroxylase (fatty acid hydroxylase superfamily)